MGFPFEHGLHCTLIASRLAERLGVDQETASNTYYACLLSHSGCTTDAHITAELFGSSLTTHLNPVQYGSRREVFGGIVRSLPPPESEDRRGRLRRHAGCRRWLGRRALTSPRRARLQRCSPRIWGFPRLPSVCFPTCSSGGMAKGRSAAQKAKTSP